MPEKINVRDEAFIGWQNGMKYKDIASKYKVSESTVKSWASRYWKNNEVAAEKKKVATLKNKAMTPEDVQARMVKALADTADKNRELTEKQKEFCVRYIQNRNATMAYLNTYECAYSTAVVNGCKMLKNAKIQQELKKLREIKNASLGYLCGDDIVEMHMRIVFADITDFVEFKSTRVPIVNKDGTLATVRVPGTNGEDDREVTRSYVESTVMLKESGQIDGTLISEIYTDKGEAHIKLIDKSKSLKFLEDYFELNPNDKHKRSFEMAKLQLEKDKFIATTTKDSGAANKESNLLEAIINSTKEDILTDDIPELQQKTKLDTDLVEQTEV